MRSRFDLLWTSGVPHLMQRVWRENTNFTFATKNGRNQPTRRPQFPQRKTSV
jgi:hypothetical protein